MTRYIENSSLSRDPIHQKMKGGQLLTFYLAKVATHTKKRSNSREIRQWDLGNLEKHLYYIILQAH